MSNHIKVVIVDDDTISIDGRQLVGRAELEDAFRTAMQNDPNVIFVIEPLKNEYYKGTGKAIYASQFVGVPVENLRYTMADGEVLTYDELRAGNLTPPA